MSKSTKSKITRQDEETELPEVCGIPCSVFQVSPFSREPFDPGLMYLKLGSNWHRFFLDAGLLFWEDGQQPDRDNDLVDGEEDYVDWGDLLGVVGVALSEVFMKDSELTLRFANGAEVVLKRMPRDDLTSIIRFTSKR